MNEKLVTSLSISQQMKEAGIEKKLDEGDWAYCSCCNKLHLFANDDDDNIYCIDHKIENVEEWHKAFTSGEIWELLPPAIEIDGHDNPLLLACFKSGNNHSVQFLDTDKNERVIWQDADTLSDALGLMLLHLKKEGLIGKEGGMKYIQCKACLANFPKDNYHVCDPLMKKLVEEKSKKKIIWKSKDDKICLRCGVSRRDIKKEKMRCTVWGTFYKRHLFK